MAYQSAAFQLTPVANDHDPVPMLHRTMVTLVRRDGTDLTARQLGVFLSVYLEKGPHTVRGLASQLNICKPAITRALDRLGELDFVRRKVDPRDRRSVLVQRTDKGWSFLCEIRNAMGEAADEGEWTKPSTVDTRRWPRAVPNHRTGFEQVFAANGTTD